MKIVKQLLDFYINSSIHVALAVYALSWITLLVFNLPYDENILYFNFYATITGYNFVKYFGIAKWHHRSLAKWLKVIQVFSFFSFLLMLFYAFRLEPKVIFVLIGLGLITFLYAIPFWPKQMYLDEHQNLRQISGLKVYIIAAVWAFTTVVLPILNNNQELETKVWITVLQNFVFVLALMIPFEIRDLKYDSIKLATIPQQIGVKKTKILGVLLLLFFLGLNVFKEEILIHFLYKEVIVAFVLMLFILFSTKHRNKYYASFWVEALPILWLLLMLF
ncbi:membrane protein [Mesoflavibacter zeaxanthinifaciens]|uniref:membrane protein n=1 Tax=Mesoflavibacter zeaxanthinifaciens TaxID=393060 RepID=UPI0003FA235E|nr:membrane protein [Mesoflavibacter zeaxanthinifaciens]